MWISLLLLLPPPTTYSASIEKYLLEKSRIVSQAPEERNYHVFYYLLSGADAETKAELQLMDIDSYQYLTQVSREDPHPYNVMWLYM